MTDQHMQISRWFEGDSCPFCDEDEDMEYFVETQGGGYDDFQRHCYACPKCGKEWYNESSFNTWEICNE